MPATPVDVDEVDDGTEAAPIDEIADGAPEDQADREPARPASRREHAQRDAREHEQRDQGKGATTQRQAGGTVPSRPKARPGFITSVSESH